MKKILLLLILVLTFSSCMKTEENSKKFTISEVQKIEKQELRAIWVSQFDMSAVYISNRKQRDKQEYTQLVEQIIQNIKKDGFNTVILQVRPNGDSFYNSKFYPISRYVSGGYDKEITYDPVEIFVNKAKSANLSVQAWVNPLRLMSAEEMNLINSKYLIKQWYANNNGIIVEVNGGLYLNPSFDQAIQLITDGIEEICQKYKFDGIHIDDYFYPTVDEFFDIAQYTVSGYSDLQLYRIDNINRLIKSIYNTVKKAKSSMVFGVSPAGNLSSLKKKHYADVKEWCSQGYVDYIMPQVYFGFLNSSCPFKETVEEWEQVTQNTSAKLYIGLTASKAVAAMTGEIDTYAGSDEGKNEWIENKDILKRSLEFIKSKSEVSGYCFFSYRHFYNPVTGQANELFEEEKSNFVNLLR